MLFRAFKIPTELNAVKIHLPCPVRQIHREFIDFESDWRLRPQSHPARRVARNGKTRADADENVRRAPKPLNQFKIRRNAEFRQLQLQNPPLNRDGQFVKMQETTSGLDCRLPPSASGT